MTKKLDAFVCEVSVKDVLDESSIKHHSKSRLPLIPYQSPTVNTAPNKARKVDNMIV